MTSPSFDYASIISNLSDGITNPLKTVGELPNTDTSAYSCDDVPMSTQAIVLSSDDVPMSPNTHSCEVASDENDTSSRRISSLQDCAHLAVEIPRILTLPPPSSITGFGERALVPFIEMEITSYNVQNLSFSHIGALETPNFQWGDEFGDFRVLHPLMQQYDNYFREVYGNITNLQQAMHHCGQIVRHIGEVSSQNHETVKNAFQALYGKLSEFVHASHELFVTINGDVRIINERFNRLVCVEIPRLANTVHENNAHLAEMSNSTQQRFSKFEASLGEAFQNLCNRVTEIGNALAQSRADIAQIAKETVPRTEYQSLESRLKALEDNFHIVTLKIRESDSSIGAKYRDSQE